MLILILSVFKVNPPYALIELFIKFMAINNNKAAKWKFEKLSQIAVDGAQTSIEFKNLYAKRKFNNEDKESDFLNYGWVEDLRDYEKIVKNGRYTIYGVMKYLNAKKIITDQDFVLYEKYYKKCSLYTHTNIKTSDYSDLAFFEICQMLYKTIFVAYEELCRLLKYQTSINNIDIIEKTKSDYDYMINQLNRIR